jgi:hypothetical protein
LVVGQPTKIKEAETFCKKRKKRNATTMPLDAIGGIAYDLWVRLNLFYQGGEI